MAADWLSGNILGEGWLEWFLIELVAFDWQSSGDVLASSVVIHWQYE